MIIVPITLYAKSAKGAVLTLTDKTKQNKGFDLNYTMMI